MSHMQLNIVLQQCPESPYFARDDFETTEAKARELIISLVERYNFSSHDSHKEANSSSESSSEASQSEGSLERLELLRSQSSQGSDQLRMIDLLEEEEHPILPLDQ